MEFDYITLERLKYTIHTFYSNAATTILSLNIVLM